MKNYTKIENQLKLLGLTNINGYAIRGKISDYRVYANFETKNYMAIYTSPFLSFENKIKLSKIKLNKVNRCKSVIELAKTDFFEKEKLNEELKFKDNLGGFVSIFENKKGQVKIDKTKTVEKQLKKLSRYGFAVKYSNNQISFNK